MPEQAPEIGWSLALPVRAISGELAGTLLGDVDSRLPLGERAKSTIVPDEYPDEWMLHCAWLNDKRIYSPPPSSWQDSIVGHPYRDADYVTWAHEGTHGVNGRLRMAWAQYGWNCFYCFEGRAFWIKEPKFRKSQVAARVSRGDRGRNFALYMTGQRAWDSRPLYILDEWIAYTNGSEAGLDLAEKDQWRGGRRHDTIENMDEFTKYASVLLATQRELDPDYAHADDLADFVEWNEHRCSRIRQDAANYPDFRG